MVFNFSKVNWATLRKMSSPLGKSLIFGVPLPQVCMQKLTKEGVSLSLQIIQEELAKLLKEIDALCVSDSNFEV